MSGRPARTALAVLALAATGCPPAFDDKFLFGASIAGFQVDPGCPTLAPEQCEDRASDWYQLVSSSAQLPDLKATVSFEPASDGPGHWELFEQDFERAKKDMGLSAIRLSIEWSRIFPTATDGLEGEALAAAANPAAIARYHAMFAALRARGMKPMVTLNHYTLPVWLHDGVACHLDLAHCTHRGWLDRERAETEAAKYAGFVAKEFGGEVDLWATENEPFAVVLPGYIFPSIERVNPPALTLRFDEAKQVTLALIEAHARMYDAVKANDLVDADGDGAAAQVGLVYVVAPTFPKNPESRLDVRAAENLFYLYNLMFLDGVARGVVDADFDGKPDAAEPRADLAGRMDWLGVNYYAQVEVTGTGSASFPTLSAISTFDPTAVRLTYDDPKGIYTALTTMKTRYHLPLYVTETGAAITDDETAGSRWLVQHLAWTKRAMKDGADVRGFFYWTLMDNYEWNRGTSMKFGLYSVAQDPPKTRTARDAVGAFRDVVKARDLPEPWAKKYPIAEP